MAATSYYKEEIPSVDKDGKADNDKPANLFEIYISSFSGEHELYLKHIDGESNESYSIINKEQANRMLEGLENAMHYLRYLK
jgi:hypothetical protein